MSRVQGPLTYFSGYERSALLAAVGSAAVGGWMAGQSPNKLAWGILMATAGELKGIPVSGGNDVNVRQGRLFASYRECRMQ